MGRERKDAHEKATPSSFLHLPAYTSQVPILQYLPMYISVASDSGHDDSHPGWIDLCLQVMLGAFASALGGA